uniref:Uncharacterized protein n=1 Tax=Schistosoma haematobium TaxID=6185 RepID=A0A094ZL83_SCHHA
MDYNVGNDRYYTGKESRTDTSNKHIGIKRDTAIHLLNNWMVTINLICIFFSWWKNADLPETLAFNNFELFTICD